MKPEQLLSSRIASFCRQWLPDQVYWNIHPAGGGGARRGVILKKMGLRAGFPDWILIYQGMAYLVEIKSGKPGPRAVQTDAHKEIAYAGGQVGVARSVDEFKQLLAFWSIPLLHHPRRAEIDDELPDVMSQNSSSSEDIKRDIGNTAVEFARRMANR